MQKFYKYNGAGNDFIIIDNRDKKFNINDVKIVKFLCNRNFGIGADGILTLENNSIYDFEMKYANNDGSIGAMCGNGGRCVVHFARYALQIINDPKKVRFLAVDGVHEAEIKVDEVKLKMHDVNEVVKRNNLPFIYSGTTPHNIMFVKDLENFPVAREGRKIRNSDPDGVNTNFVEIKDGVFNVRTYERGVEDETLACGTGATSVAIAAHHLGILKENICHLKMPGGELTVEFENAKGGIYKNIWLTGPAEYVFKGEIN